MANSLLYKNHLALNGRTLYLSGTGSGGVKIAPLTVDSNIFVANLYCERAMYSDSTGNIFSPSFTIGNTPSVGNVLTGTGSNTAEWKYPIVQTNSLIISGSASLGKVLTGTGAGTADWEVPGTIQGNITSDILTANVINVVDMTVSGTINISGNIAVDNISVVGDVVADQVFATGDVQGDQLISTVATGTAPLVVSSTTLVPNLYVARSALADVATLANALKSATTTVNVSSATAPSANQYLRATSATAAVWGDLPTTFQDTTFSVYDASDNTKQVLFNAAGSTGTSTTLTSSQTISRVLTLPDATDTLVGKATSDALSNKTVTDASNNVLARGLWNGSGSASVSVYAATIPTTGQALVATSPTTATWQTLPSAGTGMIKQIVSQFSPATVNSSGTSMPYLTTPVITDGTEFMTQAITPTSASSYLKIEVQVAYYATGGSTGRDTIALFKVGTTNALQSITKRRWNNNDYGASTIVYYVAAGSTSPMTFTVRGGNESSFAMQMDSSSAGNAIQNSFMMITELLF